MLLCGGGGQRLQHGAQLAVGKQQEQRPVHVVVGRGLQRLDKDSSSEPSGHAMRVAAAGPMCRVRLASAE